MSFHRRVRTIYGKELIDILRDRRTLIAMIVVPIVLYPLLMLGSIQAVSFQVESMEDQDIVDGDKALLQRLSSHGGLDRWARLWEKSMRLFAQEDSVNLDRKQVLLAALFDIQATAAQP